MQSAIVRALASYKCLRIDSVHAETKVIFDSGIRTGADVFKAIALGAHAVQVGRLYVWGMAHEGEAGCRHVMKSLLAVRYGSCCFFCVKMLTVAAHHWGRTLTSS
jgi:glutamate synthase domain-containing protein 2